MFTSKFGTYIEYKLNSKDFSIKVNRVEETPKYERKEGYCSESYANFYLKRVIEEPELKAKRDIFDLVAYIENEEREQEYWLEKWEEYEQDKMDDVVRGYADSLKKTHNIQEETFDKMKAALYDLIQVVNNPRSYDGFVPQSGMSYAFRHPF